MSSVALTAAAFAAIDADFVPVFTPTAASIEHAAGSICSTPAITGRRASWRPPDWLCRPTVSLRPTI